MVKRIVDITVSLILLLFLTPVLALTTVGIWLKMGTPILFRQNRPGQYEKVFYLYKYRTMSDAVDANGNVLPDKDRLTGFGVFLRKYSLDELPQLVNVIKGDMSLVGPRPLLLEYLPLYSKAQNMRHNVKPGITGWAQVNGRNAVTWEERFKMDTWYVESRTMFLDLKIIFLTIIKVIKKEGITQQNHVTMEKFTGSNDVI